jgi:mannosyltransferase OCH1-like enzyme
MKKIINKKLRIFLCILIVILLIFYIISKYESFVLLQKHQYVKNNNAKKKLKIPRKIWQTHKRNDIPESSYQGITKMIKLNKGYQYNFYDDKDMLNYMETNFDKNVVLAYNKIKPGAGKADIWRLAVILKEGGIYMDVDKIPHDNTKSFDEILDEEDEFVQGTNWHIWGTNAPSTNATLCARPNHPVIKMAFNTVIDAVNNNNPIESIGKHKGWAKLENYTGTPHLWKAISYYIGRTNMKEGKYQYGINISNKIENNYGQNKNYGNDLKELGVSHWSSQEVFT